MKQWQKLNRKVEETLAAGWKQWSAQAGEFQVLRSDFENQRKEGKGFYKMDGNNIQMIWEDLTEDFHTLADAHTKAMGTFSEEFNDNLMMWMIDTTQASDDNTLKQPNAEQPTEPYNHTSLTLQSNDKKEPTVEIANDNNNAPRPDPTTIQGDDWIKPGRGNPRYFERRIIVVYITDFYTISFTIAHFNFLGFDMPRHCAKA